MKILLWTLAAILALNALVAIGFTVWAILGRYRSPRRFVRAEAVWRLHPAGPIGVTRLPRSQPIRLGPTSVVASRSRRRSSGRRLVGIALAAAVLCAGTAFASPGARHVVAGALGAVVRRFQPEPAQQAGDADPGGDGSLLHGSGSASPEGTPATGTGPPRSAAGPGPRTATTSAGSVPTATEPASPTIVTAVSGSSSHLDLDWADVAGETGYRVERSSDGETGWIAIATTGQDVTSYSDAGLPSGTTFYYRVFATNGGGDSAPSDVASATTTIDPASPPAVTAVTASSTEIGVTWVDVAGETGYRVERSSDGKTGWIAIATTGQDVTSYSDAGLPSGTTFYYRVFATNGGGDSAPSDVASATTTDGGDVPAPTAGG